MQELSFVRGVRQTIRQKLALHGAKLSSVLDESILISNGYYCGRKFVCDEVSAVWFTEENEVKIYGSTGSLLETFQPTAESTGDVAKRAA